MLLGGYLAMITTSDEMELIKTYILQTDHTYWIGQTDQAQGKQYFLYLSFYFHVQRVLGYGQVYIHIRHPAGPTGVLANLTTVVAMRTVLTCGAG